MATAKEVTMRRFVLERVEDETGTSGTGIVVEGVQWSNGHVSIHWMSPLETFTNSPNIATIEKLHGHAGKTQVRWIDP